MSLLSDAFKEYITNKTSEKVQIVNSKHGEELYQKCKEIIEDKKHSAPILWDSIPHAKKKKKSKFLKMLLIIHLLSQSRKG